MRNQENNKCFMCAQTIPIGHRFCNSCEKKVKIANNNTSDESVKKDCGSSTTSNFTKIFLLLLALSGNLSILWISYKIFVAMFYVVDIDFTTNTISGLPVQSELSVLLISLVVSLIVIFSTSVYKITPIITFALSLAFTKFFFAIPNVTINPDQFTEEIIYFYKCLIILIVVGILTSFLLLLKLLIQKNKFAIKKL